MTVKLLTEHLLGLLSSTGGYTGLSESTLIKMPHCWKSHETAQLLFALAHAPSPASTEVRVSEHDVQVDLCDRKYVLLKSVTRW